MRQNKDGEPKYFKLFGHFSLISLLFISSLYAQSFEDFKQTQAQAFSTYKDERDAAFNKYLKQQWEEFTAFTSKPLYEKPKPKSITPTLQKEMKSIGPKVNIRIRKDVKVPEKVKHVVKKKEATLQATNINKKDLKSEKVLAIVIPVKKESNFIKKDVNFDFFGQEVGFNIDSKFRSAKFYPQSKKGILNFFDMLASSDYEEIVKSVQVSSNKLNLNDWGIYQLVTKLSNEIYSNTDDRNLFSWFIFNKLGYAVKVGLANKHIALMHYSDKIIYSTPNYQFKDKKFYVVANYAKGSVGKLYTYKQNYPGSDKPLDLQLKTLPNFKKDLRNKILSFKQFGKEYSASYHYDKNLIDFMATYPQADYETYFNSPLNDTTYKEIAMDIKKYIDAKQASVAINFVLNFVQKAFKYERDQQQFGREKVMFAEETLYYEKSDCEDRSILFSYLVKELFGIGVIGVKYSDHMATALYIPIKGDSVKAGSRKFVIADPTYINANIGQSMPKYKSKIPDSFILVSKKNN